VPSNLTSFCPDDSDSESYGAIGLRTAKLSPISDDASGAVAEHPGPMLSTELRHPYSGMSPDDYNVEPTGTLGLTADELVSVGDEFIFGTTPPGLDRDEKLFTSTVTRPTPWVDMVQDQESLRANLNLRCQERLDNMNPKRSGESIPLADATSYDCKGPGNVKRPRNTLALRLDKTGSLVRMPNLVQCDCTRCQEMIFPAATDDQSSAKRKPIPPRGGSRDSADVPTLTDVTTRPPMYDAGGAERLGVEVSCPSEASPQDAVMSCPTVASSQDVRPGVSTADATVHNQVMSTADDSQIGQVTGFVESAATVLILCDGSTEVDRSQLVNDNELSVEQNRLAYSTLLKWKPHPRVETVDGIPHFNDAGDYLSDGQCRTDDRRVWHGKNHSLTVNRGLYIPSYTLDLTDQPGREQFLVPCLLTPNDQGMLRIPLSADGQVEMDTDVPHRLYSWDDIRSNNFTRNRARLDEEHGKQTEFPKDVPEKRIRMNPTKLAKRRELFLAVLASINDSELPNRCRNVSAAQKWLERLHEDHFDRLNQLRRGMNLHNPIFPLAFALSSKGRSLDTPVRVW